MGKSKTEFDQLTYKQKMFVVEYITDLNGARAAREAGYKGDTSLAAVKLLKNPKVKKAVEESLGPAMEEAKLTKESVLRQLSYFLFRDIAEFFDDEGYLRTSPAKLPEHVRQCIDSWELDREYDEDGNISSERYKVKCVSKATALDLAMKYLKLTGPEVVQNNISVNFWQEFFDRANEPLKEPVDAIITKMLEAPSGSENGQSS